MSWALAPGTPPGSYCEDPRKISRLWREEEKVVPVKYVQSLLHNKGRHYGENTPPEP